MFKTLRGLGFIVLLLMAASNAYGQSSPNEILRKKEYTLDEWYGMNPDLYIKLLQPASGEFEKEKVRIPFVEKKSLNKARNRQVCKYIESGAVVNSIHYERISSFMDGDGYILSDNADFGNEGDSDSIRVYLPLSVSFNGTITIRLDSEFGPVIGHINFTKTDRRNKLIQGCTLYYSNIYGRHDVYFFYPREFNGHDLSGFPSRDTWLLKR